MRPSTHYKKFQNENKTKTYPPEVPAAHFLRCLSRHK